MRNDFCAFILSHGRPSRVYTINALKRAGYTGRIIILIDNEDNTADEYKRRFGENVVVFDKSAVEKTFDTANNFTDRCGVVYARNACFTLAQKMGLRYFVQLDDDYTGFLYKFNRGVFEAKQIKRLDCIFDLLIDLLEKTGALSVAMAQNGDFMGGALNDSFVKNKTLKRKCMNSFVCKTDRPFQFVGHINEDVNTYVSQGMVGKLFFTVPDVALQQTVTQVNPGGMTQAYTHSGTYIKSFYTVLFAPSCVTIRRMGVKHMRIHHHISWDNTVPCILPETAKK